MFFLSGPPQALTLRPEPRGLSVPQGKVMVLFSLDLGAPFHPLLEVLPHKPLGIESLTPSVISLSLFFLQPQLAQTLYGLALSLRVWQEGPFPRQSFRPGRWKGQQEAAMLGKLGALARLPSWGC